MPTVHVVAAHYNEEVEWIKNLRYPCDVVSVAGVPENTPPNKGREAASYLRWIISNYEKLSDYVVFVHAHRESPHCSGKIDDRINALLFAQDYCNINTQPAIKLVEQCPECFSILRRATPVLSGLLRMPIEPAQIFCRCCAQFYVSKQALHRYSLNDYRAMYAWLCGTDMPSRESAIAFEYVWHIIFTGNHVDC